MLCLTEHQAITAVINVYFWINKFIGQRGNLKNCTDQCLTMTNFDSLSDSDFPAPTAHIGE